jgi:hypothetical protein
MTQATYVSQLGLPTERYIPRRNIEAFGMLIRTYCATIFCNPNPSGLQRLMGAQT